jgi:NADH:ubiquinone oxidoreductase subunit K
MRGYIGKRFAWGCSMFGACSLLCVCLAYAVLAVGGILFDWDDISKSSEFPVFFCIFAIGVVCLELAVSSGLVIALLKLRTKMSQAHDAPNA